MTPTSSKSRNSPKSANSSRSREQIQARSANAQAAREKQKKLSAEKPPPDVFRRAFFGLVAGLVALSVIFLLLGSSQGPKVSDAEFDSASVVSRPDQQLRLFLNQPVQDASTATARVDPSIPATVSSSEDVVAVQFGAPLFYDTDYSVTVDGLRAVGSRASTAVDYRFTTGSPTLMYLDRGDDIDTIIRTGLTGSERTTVFTAERIVAFAVTGQVLAVASASEDGSSKLQLISLADGAIEDVRLPEPGVISKLAASNVGSVLGFTFTPSSSASGDQQASILLVVDLESGRDLVPVGDLGDGPLLISDWVFVPNTVSVIALGVEGVALRFEPARGAVPLPIGRFASIAGVSQDGTTLIGEDTNGTILTNLADGTQRTPTPSMIDGTPAYVAEIAIAWNGEIVEKAAIQVGDGLFSLAIAVDDGSTARAIYLPSTATPGVDMSAGIDRFQLSPNGQYVALELIPDGTADQTDSNPTNPRPTSTTTIVVDVETGVERRSFEGFNLVWLPPGT